MLFLSRSLQVTARLTDSQPSLNHYGVYYKGQLERKLITGNLQWVS